MKKFGERCKNEEGVALILAIGTIMIMIIIGTVILMNVRNSNSTAFHDRMNTKAVNVANAGLDNAIAAAIANYNSFFPGGVTPPPPTNSPDGTAVYSSPQNMTDPNGNVTGTYQAWYKQDPNNSGRVLITSQGTVNQKNKPFTVTARVSVAFTTGAFDYAFLAGTQLNNNTTTSLSASSGGDSYSSAGANMTFTGKFNVNGNLKLNSYGSGEEDDDWAPAGVITFQTRPGFTSPRDPVTYTGSYYYSTPPGGTLPVHAPSYVQFPTVDFSKFTSLGSSKIITVNLPYWGTPSGGWNRSGSTFYIDANTFQQTYGSYQVVRFTSGSSGMVVQIQGGCGSDAITPTLMMDEGTAGNTSTAPSELIVTGSGISLQPTDGVAILSNYGTVLLQSDVVIGSDTAGALVYLGGLYGTNTLNVSGNLAMWGSLVVNGPANIATTGKGEDDSDAYHHLRHTASCGDDEIAIHETNTSVAYGSEFLTNPDLPAGWWTWTGGNGVTALKYNYKLG